MNSNLKESLKRLVVLWGIGALIAILLLLARTMKGAYKGVESEVWTWALPHFMPTVMLLVGSFLYANAKPKAGRKKMDSFLFNTTLTGSAIYFLVFLSIVAIHPYLDGPTLETFRNATWGLAPLQGLIAAFIGAFSLSDAE